MATTTEDTTGAVPISCARCAVELQPGAGNFYRITIEAAADPWPPTVSADDATDLRQRIERVLSQIADMSEQDVMDQVYRRLTLYLCGPCYRQWIASPVR